MFKTSRIFLLEENIMANPMLENYSKDGYGYWGYVEKEHRMMKFVSREEYLEYISDDEDDLAT